MKQRRDGRPSNRQLKVGEQLRHLLAEALMRGELHDPALDTASVTVSEARMSPDLRQAQVFVSELGLDAPRETTMAALDRASGYLGGFAARRMNLKYAPRLTFVVDDSFANAAKLDRLLYSSRGRTEQSG